MRTSNSLESMERGRQRAVIEVVLPKIAASRYALKRTVGERVVVEADIFADGHEALSAVLKYRLEKDEAWLEVAMIPLGSDCWRGEFEVREPGVYCYTVAAWVDRFKTWRQALLNRIGAGEDLANEWLTGAGLIEAAVARANPEDAARLREAALVLRAREAVTQALLVQTAMDDALAETVTRCMDRNLVTTCEPELRVVVDPVLARFGAWYEMFPRSCARELGRHGTFKDCEAELPRIAEMGFDVLYFPPIHPIGRTLRKGKNNQPVCQPGEPGSPWGIGAAEGGHKAVHPELGTLEDFRQLAARARELKIEIALDIAFLCSPDHPYVTEHLEWFRKRPDGSIQYAENPPKKYQDIFPFDFECEDWRGLWRELKSIFDFWIEQGVRVFRVDNPHTKAFTFWEWCFAELKREHPELIFLAEAFTRPTVKYHLARLGFTQSYNYFPWRNTRDELAEYLTELTRSSVAEFFRPNLWTNTPDILTQYLQHGERAAFMAGLILAATLGASYWIYGPAFELCENRPREPGSEEYLDSRNTRSSIGTWAGRRAFEI